MNLATCYHQHCDRCGWFVALEKFRPKWTNILTHRRRQNLKRKKTGQNRLIKQKRFETYRQRGN